MRALGASERVYGCLEIGDGQRMHVNDNRIASERWRAKGPSSLGGASVAAAMASDQALVEVLGQAVAKL